MLPSDCRMPKAMPIEVTFCWSCSPSLSSPTPAELILLPQRMRSLQLSWRSRLSDGPAWPRRMHRCSIRTARSSPSRKTPSTVTGTADGAISSAVPGSARTSGWSRLRQRCWAEKLAAELPAGTRIAIQAFGNLKQRVDRDCKHRPFLAGLSGACSGRFGQGLYHGKLRP